MLKRPYHQGHSEDCRRRIEECLKDDERMKAARQRMTEYAAERVREDDMKRRKKDEKEKEKSKSEEPKESEESQASSSSSGKNKRERAPEDTF